MPPVQFGYSLPIFANPGNLLFRTPNMTTLDARQTLALGVHAEALGFDSLWVADHLMLGRDEAILEGWTTLAALGGATSRAKLGIIHQAHYFRTPAITAKMAATLDQLTDGRFIFFYDYGHQQREHQTYHLPYPDDPDVRATEVLSGLQLILALWAATEPISAEFGPYQITNATCTPRPIQTPHPPIWFGEINPTLLAGCAKFAQGWNTTPVGIPELQRRLALLKAACDQVGRDFATIEKSAELQILIAPEGETPGTLQRILANAPDQSTIDPALRRYAEGETAAPPTTLTDTTLIGSPAEVRAQLQRYVAAGVSHFLLWFLDAPDRSGMELFAKEVAPLFRAR